MSGLTGLSKTLTALFVRNDSGPDGSAVCTCWAAAASSCLGEPLSDPEELSASTASVRPRQPTLRDSADISMSSQHAALSRVEDCALAEPFRARQQSHESHMPPRCDIMPLLGCQLYITCARTGNARPSEASVGAEGRGNMASLKDRNTNRALTLNNIGRDLEVRVVKLGQRGQAPRDVRVHASSISAHAQEG